MTDKGTEMSKLVILGASYAGSWGTPALPGYVVVNRGVSGEPTGGMRGRFSGDVAKESPQAVLIWGHVNNITQADITNATPEKIEAVKKGARDDYLAMLDQARAAGIEVLLATEIPLAEAGGWVNEARALVGYLLGKQSYAARVNVQVRELNAFLRELAQKERLRLLDFEKVFAPDGGPRRREYATDDLSHISPAGYDALTAYTVAELRRKH